MTDLTELDFSSNKISDINILSKLANLYILSLNDNEIEEIPDLSNLNNLQYMNLSNNYITNFEPISPLNIDELIIEPQKNKTEIEKIDISEYTVYGITDEIFTGKEIRPVIIVKDGETVLKNGVDYEVSYENNVNIVIATVIITGKDDYVGKISKTFKINTINLSKFTVTGITNKTYTGKTLTQSIVVKNGKTTLKKGTDYNISYKNNKNIGTATVTITGKGKYTGKITKTFKIKAPKIKTPTISKIKAGNHTVEKKHKYKWL